MKIYALVFLFLTAVFANVSCSKNNAAASQAEDEAAPVVETLANGMILSKNASLFLFGRDGEMHPFVKLSQGADIFVLELDGNMEKKFVSVEKDSSETLDLESGDGNSGNLENIGNLENPERALDGTEYVHAVYDNVDFWLESSVFALDCEKAVAIEKAFLYADSSLTQKLDASPNPLEFAAFVAMPVLPQEKKAQAETEENLSEEQKSKAARIFYYDTAANSVREAFVLRDSVSAQKDDIEVCKIVEQLKATTRAAPRNELFAKAGKYNPGAKVLAALNAQKIETKTYNYQEVLKSVQRMSFGVNVDELLTVDQSKDPFK